MEASINIADKDQRIEKIVKDFLIKDWHGDCYHFEKHPDDRFKVQFYVDEEILKQTIAQEKEKADKISEPRWTTCILF